MIRYVNITKSFGSHRVVDNFSLELTEGEIHFIVGFSGAGKSVLIRHAIGLLAPDSGQCFVDEYEVSALTGKALDPVRRKCQMVFQQAALFDSMTLQENIAMPLRKRHGISRKEADIEALKYLELVGCSQQANLLPGQIGIGIQKCVAIARAIALEPKYILYDEPTTGLTPLAARRIDQLIKQLTIERGITAVVVSHDMISTRTIADRIHFLYDTHLYFSGNAKQFFNSDSPAIQGFIKPLVATD